MEPIEINEGITMEEINEKLEQRRKELDRWAEGWANKFVEEGKIKPEDKDKEKKHIIDMPIEMDKFDIAYRLIWQNGIADYIVRFLDIRGKYIREKIKNLKEQYPDLPIDNAINALLEGEKLQRASVLTEEELKRIII